MRLINKEKITWSLGEKSLEMTENKFLQLKQPSLWYFVMAAQIPIRYFPEGSWGTCEV